MACERQATLLVDRRCIPRGMWSRGGRTAAGADRSVVCAETRRGSRVHRDADPRPPARCPSGVWLGQAHVQLRGTEKIDRRS